MGQEGSDLEFGSGSEEYEGLNDTWRASQESNLCLPSSLCLSRELLAILYNPTAKEWDPGFVMLRNGKKFGLWTTHHPEPIARENEAPEAFASRKIAARQARYAILENRAQRVASARQDLLDQQRREQQDHTEEEEEEQARLDREREVERLSRLVKDAVNPTDALMFRALVNIEAEEARAAFKKVQAADNTQGMDVLTPEEKAAIVKYRATTELHVSRVQDETARQLGVFEMINQAIAASGLQTRTSSDIPKVLPIRVKCPNYSPGTDPIGSLETWLAGVNNFLHLNRVEADLDKKRVLFSSVDNTAQFRLGSRLLPDSSHAASLTYKQYAEEVRLVFSPPGESQLWKSDYRNFKQLRGTTVTDYVQRKAQLFRLGYNVTNDSEHFIEETIANIFHNGVRREVYRADPKTFAELVSACQQAVGLVRQMETPTSPGLVGLASISHPVQSPPSKGTTSLMGEMGSTEDFEEEEVEPLTIAQMEFCIFNEEQEETDFWDSQSLFPEDEDEGAVGELGPQSPASPDGPCWVCNAPGHVKARCPARLNAVHSKYGASRPKFGRGGRRFEEVRRGSSRPNRGRRAPWRGSRGASGSPTSPSGRYPSDSRDSRNGILPFRSRKLGEMSEEGPEDEAGRPHPGEGGEVAEEMGGLYEARQDF